MFRMPKRWRAAAIMAVPALALAGMALATPAASASPAAVHPAPVKAAGIRTTRAASTAHGPSEYANTAISYRPDSGSQGNDWAYDFMTRRLHDDRVGQVSGTFCGLAASHVCYRWNWTLYDTGTFQTIKGQDVPGPEASTDGNVLEGVEQGTFSGHQSGFLYDTYANAYPGDVEATENDNGNLPSGMQTSGEWARQMFAGAGFPSGDTTTNFIYPYSVAAGADSACAGGHWGWLDSQADGSGSLPADGNIFAPNAADCPATPNTTSS